MKQFSCLWLVCVCFLFTNCKSLREQSPVSLEQEDTASSSVNNIDENVYFKLGQMVSVEKLDFNRVPTVISVKELKEKYGLHYPKFGFRWAKEDDDSPHWYPQGTSGMFTKGKRILAVSWYNKEKENRGIRISFADVTDPKNVRYRHVLLVEKKRA